MPNKDQNIAVILHNLGGPDDLRSVRPFLFNLFNDRAIINAPQPIRWCLARLISSRRAPAALKIYRELGGGSPLRANTEIQAAALTTALSGRSGPVTFRCFIAMRYWHPMSGETARQVRDWDPDGIILLPLYPQFSSTTTGSSFAAWRRAADRMGLVKKTTAVCCYPQMGGFIDTLARNTAAALLAAGGTAKARVLFSAHGLPRKVIAGGDPYQIQVEATARAIASALGEPDLDWVVCYQSRVGPLEWIGPYTEDEISRAGGEGKSLAVVPIAFVSEHSETLVELDIEYRALADTVGVPSYVRAPTVASDPAFIDGLADLVEAAIGGGRPMMNNAGQRICPSDCGQCPHPE